MEKAEHGDYRWDAPIYVRPINLIGVNNFHGFNWPSSDRFAALSVPKFTFQPFGSMFRIRGPGHIDLLFYELLTRGVYVWEGRSCFLSTTHTAEDIAFVANAIESAALALHQSELLD